ncbi:biopolymer transporter ExbD [Megasphaera cerevisiae DSM 20462]|uniref:Biopolymer transporter ExbD n=1 Tax=Megasphaera cerevisiae DSM 20462 TaxID=1122219 RepID=A0A0J6WYN3_9FIRM|nr:biopolymer transporter ExbD [Megasphaera cerevisiae]KMO87373.1 biopolymer transporter ExbD [Megasphaera cerevisiae DSM 20462]OKY54828.1 biopolymer transporter ExbD [Megasphaera cerevisiae]SJZ38907.1 biopolymer transport protein ExbD [Megasphaera cerevisiae DSM 20462]
MFTNARMKKKPVFMIIPMIDIIFFLLVFFMMNSLQTIAQKALSMQLPQAQSASAPVQMPIILTVDAEGHITLDNKPVTIDEASGMMKKHMSENANAAVILQADKQTAHGQVVAVMDMLKSAGVKRLAIAAQQKG